VKGGLANQIDWNLTIIAAFSFMLHFGLIGAMYSDWMDPIITDDANIQGLIDLAKSVPPPPVEEKPAEETKTPDSKAPEQKAAPAAAELSDALDNCAKLAQTVQAALARYEPEALGIYRCGPYWCSSLLEYLALLTGYRNLLLIVAAILGGAFWIKRFWRKVKSFFTRGKKGT